MWIGRSRWLVKTDMKYATGGGIASSYVWSQRSGTWLQYSTANITDPRKRITFWTRKSADSAALLIVTRNPELIGKVYVEEFRRAESETRAL